MSSRVTRSKRPDAARARERDAAFVASALQRFVAAYQRFMPPPASLYSAGDKARYVGLANAMRHAVMGWCRDPSVPPGAHTATWDADVFPRLALRDRGALVGFDFLRSHATGQVADFAVDFPTPYDADGTYSSLGAYSTFAFMLQSELAWHTSPRIDLHVLTKGLVEFNADGRRPHLMGAELVTYVHTDLNLEPFIAALVSSDAFRAAAAAPFVPGQQQQLRRIVVPVLLTGHFQVFGWDRTFDAGSGEPVHDRLFVMTSMLPESFDIDPRASDHILHAFGRRLEAEGLLLRDGLRGTELTPYPGAGIALRALPRTPEFQDIGCYYLALLYTFFLAMAEDLNSPDLAAALTQTRVWHTFRAGCAAYDARQLHLLEQHAAAGKPLLFGPSWNATFLNVRDARLANTDGDRFRYAWDDGWLVTPAAAATDA